MNILRRIFQFSFCILALGTMGACSVSTNAENYTLKMSQLSAASYSGVTFPLQPTVGFYQTSTGAPDPTASDLVQLTPYLDTACSVPAVAASYSINQSKLQTSGGLATFSGATYTWPVAHMEGPIYFKVSTLDEGLYTCASPIYITRHFNLGLGYVNSGNTGAAPAGLPVATENDAAAGMVVDSQGRYVAVGDSEATAGAGGGWRFALWRYFPDGTIDTSFGGGGSYAGVAIGGTTGAAGGSGGTLNENPNSVMTDSNGNYVSVGYSEDATSGIQAAAWRYSSSGIIDGSFGAGGTLALGNPGAAGGSWDDAYMGAIDSAGRIILIGETEFSVAGRYEMAVWRLTPTGGLDNTFEGGGCTNPAGCVIFGTTGAAGGTGASLWDYAMAIAIDSEGRYVIAGSSASSGSEGAGHGGEMTLWRLNSNGTLDSTFGSGNCNIIGSGGMGCVHFGPTGAAGGTAANLEDIAMALVIDSSGKIIVGGASRDNSVGANELAIWRYNSNGTIDTSFGTGGCAGGAGPGNGYGCIHYGLPNAAGNATAAANEGPGTPWAGSQGIAIDSEGRYVLAGNTNTAASPELAIWRYNTNGTLDTTFNGTGHVVMANPLSAGAQQYVYHFYLDPAGRYNMSGYSQNSSGGLEMMLWRFLSTGAIDQ